jgi:hypothetical protein
MVPSIRAYQQDHKCAHNIVRPSPTPGRLKITTATNDKINKHLSHKDTKEDGRRDCHQIKVNYGINLRIFTTK